MSAHPFDVGAFIIVACGGRGGVIRWRLLQACERRRSNLPHLHNGVVRWSLLPAWGRRSGAAVAKASHLLTRGRKRSAARGRSKPPVGVSGMLLRELWMLLANHGWPNVEKTTTCIRSKFGAYITCTKIWKQSSKPTWSQGSVYTLVWLANTTMNENMSLVILAYQSNIPKKNLSKQPQIKHATF
jgi:hypothetical protein